MARILRIDASARTEGSHSRELADLFEQNWLQRYPGDVFIRRDVAKNPLPHIEEMTVVGFYTPKEQHDDAMKSATALSDKMIEEFLSADYLLISTPMYNFSIPSALKAYIDQIVRIGYTFGFDEKKGLFGIVTGKKAYVISASGLMYAKGPLSNFNFSTSYLQSLLHFLGINAVEIIAMEGSSLDKSVWMESKKAAQIKIVSLIAGKDSKIDGK